MYPELPGLLNRGFGTDDEDANGWGATVLPDCARGDVCSDNAVLNAAVDGNATVDDDAAVNGDGADDAVCNGTG